MRTPFGSGRLASNGRLRMPPIMENLPRDAGRTPRLAWPHPTFQRGGSSYLILQPVQESPRHPLTNVHGTAGGAHTPRDTCAILACNVLPCKSDGSGTLILSIVSSDIVFSSFELGQVVFRFPVAGARITASALNKVCFWSYSTTRPHQNLKTHSALV
jgi:hypothetical protein